jgi:chemotaxis protein MotD
VPHVASDSKSYALNNPLPRSYRPPQAADRAASTPFDSLIDDSAPPAPEPRAREAADDPLPRADRPQQDTAAAPEQTDKPAQADEKTKAASDDKQQDAAAADGPNADATTAESKDASKPAGETTVKPNTKAGKSAKEAEAVDALKSGEDSKKKVGDGKGADTVDPGAVALTTTPAPTITPADAIAVAITPAPAAPGAAATDGSANDEVKAAATPATKAATQAAGPDLLAALQAKGDKGEKKAGPQKATEGDKTAPKATPGKFALNAKAAPEADGTSDKDAAGHARALESANLHRSANAELAAATPAGDHAAAQKAPDATQTLVLNTPAPATQAQTQSPAPAAVAPPAPQTVAVPITGVGVEITSKALAGNNHFEIRLDPPELGRIQVHLNVDRDGNVTSRVIADRHDTLDLLRRDTTGLERALQDAGLKTSDNSLQFSLRDQSANQQQQQQDHRNTNAAHLVVEDETLPSVEATQYVRYGTRAGGLDISV